MRLAWLNFLLMAILAAVQFASAAEAPRPTDAWPDIYPSATAATLGISEQITAKLQKLSPSYSTIIITQQSGSTISNDVIDDITTQLATRFPKSHVQIDRSVDPHPATSPTVTLSGTSIWTSPDPQPDNGEITANVTGPITATFHGQFVHKPWLDDFASFSNANPGFTWFVGKSNSHCSTPADADQSARDDLARQLAADVKSRLQSAPAHRPEADIYLQARNMLRGDIHLDDKFLQRFTGHGGASWQEAILFNSQNQNFANLITFATSPSPAPLRVYPDESHATSIKAGIALVIVIFLLYLFLNWITKDYFATRSRITTIVFQLLAVALILLGLLAFGRMAYIPAVEQQTAQMEQQHLQAVQQQQQRIVKEQATATQVQN